MSLDLSWHDESRELGEAARRSAAGYFIHLSQGYTHYEVGRAGIPPDVILVHGFSAPYFIWDPTFSALAAGGRNPLRYDLFGRGFSDRPRVDYDLELFLAQLVELLDVLDVNEVSLIGLSMGGAIAAAFTVRHPSRVCKLVLIDPAGVRSLPSRRIYQIAVLPGVGEMLMALVGSNRWMRRAASSFFESGHDRRFQSEYRKQMELRGFKRAILSTLRQHMLDPMVDVYRELGRLSVPTMLIWGEEDRMVPLEHSRDLLRLVPGMIFHAIPGSGHTPHYEDPGRVNPLLLDFLRKDNVAPN
jgi:pimeloyl-ACP methyl ester carboxylesterase